MADEHEKNITSTRSRPAPSIVNTTGNKQTAAERKKLYNSADRFRDFLKIIEKTMTQNECKIADSPKSDSKSTSEYSILMKRQIRHKENIGHDRKRVRRSNSLADKDNVRESTWSSTDSDQSSIKDEETCPSVWDGLELCGESYWFENEVVIVPGNDRLCARRHVQEA